MPEKFSHGQMFITPRARELLCPHDVFQCLGRHLSGDWGELSESDKKRNDLALAQGYRLLSAFRDRNGVPFWIITEGDRLSTIVLLPADY